MKLVAKFLIMGLFLISTSLQAKMFTSQYCEFQLPGGWQCALEGTEWVCQSTNEERKKEAIIILAAKIRGPQDSLDKYQAYLKQSKTFTLPGGKTQVSEPKYAKMINVNSHRWVDALHMASEVPGFYTRYLATVKKDLGVAVTFSVAKDHYQEYREMFDRMVNSLRVFRQKGEKLADFQLKKKDEDLLDDVVAVPDDGPQWGIGVDQKGGPGSGGGGSTTNYLILLAIIGGGGFFAMKKLKGKKKGEGKGKGKKKKKKKSSKKS